MTSYSRPIFVIDTARRLPPPQAPPPQSIERHLYSATFVRSTFVIKTQVSMTLTNETFTLKEFLPEKKNMSEFQSFNAFSLFSAL